MCGPPWRCLPGAARQLSQGCSRPHETFAGQESARSTLTSVWSCLNLPLPLFWVLRTYSPCLCKTR